MKLFQARFSVLRASLRTLGSAALVVSVVLTAVLGNVSPVLADSGWGVAQRLDGYDSYSTDPQVAMDGLHAVAVWVQHNNWSYDTYEIYSNYSTDGGASWDAPQRVDTGTVRYSDAPRLSVSGPIAVAVWYAWLDMGAGLETRVLSSHSHDGGASWSAPVAIDVSGATGPTEPEVTVSGTTVVATWRQDDVSGPRIYINSSNDGGVTWSGPQIIDPGLGYSIESPRLAVDGSRVVAVWRTNHYSEAVWDWVKDIYSNYSLDGGETWGTAQVISTTTEVYSPHVTMFGSNVVAAWYDGGGNPRIYTNRSVDGGESWEGPQAIDDGSAWGKYSPRLAMYGNTVAAIWSQWQAGYTFPRLCGIRSTDGGTTWDNRQFLDNTIHGVFSEPQIAALGSGFITVWGGTDGYASHIRGRVSKDGGATWDTPETIRDNVDGHPRLATGSSAVAVWSYQHSGRTDIEANHFFQPEPPPLLLDMWGTRGSGDGQFRNPSGITVGPDGRVYVLEDGNHRVQVFDVDGNYLLKWGGSGSDPGEFRYPKIGIVVDGDGNIVVADSGRHRIQVFEPDGSNPVVWGESGGGELQFSHPRGIAIGAGGHIYVCDYGNDRIQVLTSSGEYHKEWGEEGSDPGQLDGPQGIAIDGDGNVYVVDTLNHRVQVFDSDGVFIRTWGSEGDGNGQFQWPRDIAISQDERVYVTDTFNHRIQMFDLEGKYLG